MLSICRYVDTDTNCYPVVAHRAAVRVCVCVYIQMYTYLSVYMYSSIYQCMHAYTHTHTVVAHMYIICIYTYTHLSRRLLVLRCRNSIARCTPLSSRPGTGKSRAAVAPIYISCMSVCLSVCVCLSLSMCVCMNIHIYVYIAGGIAGRTSGHKHGVEVDYKILGGRRRLRARNGAFDGQRVLLAPHVACREV
jgi:hypothetical protein